MDRPTTFGGNVPRKDKAKEQEEEIKEEDICTPLHNHLHNLLQSTFFRDLWVDWQGARTTH